MDELHGDLVELADNSARHGDYNSAAAYGNAAYMLMKYMGKYMERYSGG